MRSAKVNYQRLGYDPVSLDDQRHAMDRLLIFKDQYERLLADLEHFRIYIAPIVGKAFTTAPARLWRKSI